jgi:hypothetical protein
LVFFAVMPAKLRPGQLRSSEEFSFRSTSWAAERKQWFIDAHLPAIVSSAEKIDALRPH